MDNKFTYLISGLVVIFVVFLGVILIVTRADKVAPVENTSGILTQKTITEAKDKVQNLQNFGNLPLVVTQDQIGKDNPFAR